MSTRFHPPLRLTTLAALLLASSAPQSWAQTPPNDDPTVLETRVAAPRARDAKASIAGFGNTPAWKAPAQAASYSKDTLREAQVRQLSDLTTLDASLSDAYNAPGYWSILALRGFELDLTQNYLREGLPISAETSLPLDNKSGVEVFKGTSGIQSGISAPGGLINLLVKRPAGSVRSAELSWSSSNSLLGSLDLSERLGAEQMVGVRLNAAHETLRPNQHPSDGQRHLVALAADWRIQPGTLLEVEVEHSRIQQNSMPGQSLHGGQVPDADDLDPDLNLNGQAWTRPTVMEGSTGSIRLTQALGSQWTAVGIYGEQHLRADDRAAFPFGCATETGLDDRYCSDGTYVLYNYQSDNEARITRALDVSVSGPWQTGSVKHDLTLGLARSTQRIDVPTAVFDVMGIGDSSGNLVQDFFIPIQDPQNLRRQTTTALYVRDAITLAPGWTAWAGIRTTRLERRQSLSDGSVPEARLSDTMTTPWLALGHEFAPRQQVYISWGEGVENLLAPLKSTQSNYLNAGEYLPAVKSRQTEIGYKAQLDQLYLGLNWFRISRPQGAYVTNGIGETRYQLDGRAVHQGIEGEARGTVGAWSWSAAAMVLDAKRKGSQTPGVNGLTPTNVPSHTLKLGGQWRAANALGLTLGGALVHEGSREVDIGNTIDIPAWTRLDAFASLVQRTSGGGAVTWQLGVKNLLDTRAWRESPNKFGHIYLSPLASRTATLTARFDF
ncbi:MAG TPA: TonB-dependent siderophore receptor [Aquabacterium sp.]|nr:TonB-dependent siderophore receptor [Aquabacterium sp.]HRH29096.1 TonB-dependent siderophore receptor [Aquabacterium sp.]